MESYGIISIPCSNNHRLLTSRCLFSHLFFTFSSPFPFHLWGFLFQVMKHRSPHLNTAAHFSHPKCFQGVDLLRILLFLSVIYWSFIDQPDTAASLSKSCYSFDKWLINSTWMHCYDIVVKFIYNRH